MTAVGAGAAADAAAEGARSRDAYDLGPRLPQQYDAFASKRGKIAPWIPSTGC